MTRLAPAFRNPAVASLILATTVFAIVGIIREIGLFQSAEFIIYDKALAWRAGAESVEPRTALVEITEADIAKYDFPIPDHLLSELLRTISAAKPAVIGLDIYRDVAVPRDASQLPELNRILAENQKIVGIFKFGDHQHPIRISFPPALAKNPERYGFNDFPFELGAVRRAFLFLWDDQQNVYMSFALALALQTGVDVQQEGSGLRIGKTMFRRFRSYDGAYVRAQDGGHQFLLDFKSPRKFLTYSLDDVLSRRVADEAWRDKLVLIGEGAESAHDFETTPLQQSVPGVELHAQVLNQILCAAEKGDEPTASWSEPVELGWIFLCCVLGGATGWFLRRPLVTLVVCLSVAAGLGAIGWVAFQRDLWIPFVPAITGNLAAGALVIGYTRYQERRDRETLMRLFSQNVSPQIAEVIWTHRDEFMKGNRPQPQKLFATVLFTDFRNFSTVSEKLQPADAIHWVNEYMNALARHVDRHGGLIDKYMGDAIMAVFGFPLALTAQADSGRDAGNAVRCALAMGDELDRLNREWQTRVGSPVLMRIGIFSGPTVAGCIGSSNRLEFTMIGDTVNTASRLESFDRDYASDETCRILIGQSTLDLLDGQFATELVGTIRLKGKEEMTTIYRIVGGNI